MYSTVCVKGDCENASQECGDGQINILSLVTQEHKMRIIGWISWVKASAMA